MDEKENINETDKKIYEVGYLLVPNLSGEEIPAIYGNLKELTVRLGGEVIADEMPKMINLAYMMSKVIANVSHKFNTAYFGWIKFSMNPEKISDLKKHLTQDSNFLRFLIIKTVKENTISSRRFLVRDISRRRGPITRKLDVSETTTPINKEEIDKEIDALVSS